MFRSEKTRALGAEGKAVVLTKILVTFPLGAESEASNVKTLAKATTCCCAVVEVNDRDIASTDCGECDIILVIIGTSAYDQRFEDKLEECAKSGVLIFGVWISTVASTSIPKVLKDFGSGELTQTPDDFEKALCGQTPIWKTPSGEPRPEPPLKRNKCR